MRCRTFTMAFLFLGLIAAAGRDGECAPQVMWAETFDSDPGEDTVAGVSVHPAGGAVVTGYSMASQSGTRVLRYGASGALLWTRFLPDFDAPSPPAVTPGGDVFVAGYRYEAGLGRNVLAVAKYGTGGNVLLDNNHAALPRVRPTSRGGFLALPDGAGDLFVAGNLDNAVTGNGEIFLAKIRGTDGALLWTGRIAITDASGNSLLNEIYNDRSLALTASGDPVVCGYVNESDADDIIVAKFSSTDGTPAGPVRYDLSGDNEEGYVVRVAPDNTIYVGGRAREPGGSYEALLLRFDPDLAGPPTALRMPGLGNAIYSIDLEGNDNVLVASRGTAAKLAAPGLSETWSFSDPSGGRVADLVSIGNTGIVALVNRSGLSVAVLFLGPDNTVASEASYPVTLPDGKYLALSGTTLYVGGNTQNATDQDILLLRVGEPDPPPPPAGGGGGCFLATAAWGSPLAIEVATLRAFRDRILLANRAGRAIVGLYYGVSPPLARAIEGNGYLREVTRFFLVPAVLFSRVMLGTPGFAVSAVIVLIVLALFAFLFPEVPRLSFNGPGQAGERVVTIRI